MEKYSCRYHSSLEGFCSKIFDVGIPKSIKVGRKFLTGLGNDFQVPFF
jgi:hypothetical protein